ncbi:hypothetical protein KJ966_10185 [bacterium]|nr:hypothetical protein [bacterium]
MKKLSAETLSIIQWMANNPGFENPQLYAEFPKKSPANLRGVKTKYIRGELQIDKPETGDNRTANDTSIKKTIDASTQSESHQGETDSTKHPIEDNESKNACTDTSIETKDSKNDSQDALKDTSKDTSIDASILKDETEKSIQPDERREIDYTSKNESTNESTFIKQLSSRQETLFKILDEYDQSGSLPLGNIELKPPYRTVSYSLMESTVKKFIEVCQQTGLSQRKGIHLAMKEIINRYGHINNSSID